MATILKQLNSCQNDNFTFGIPYFHLAAHKLDFCQNLSYIPTKLQFFSYRAFWSQYFSNKKKMEISAK